MKRINRKKLISDLEFLRNGFASAKLNAQNYKNNIDLIAFDAYHMNADRMIVELGGESVRETEKLPINKILRNGK